MDDAEIAEGEITYKKVVQISEFVTLKIDEDDDVHIINKFMETKIMVLPREEAEVIAKTILEAYESS